ncbi:MAG: hypothetical protein INR62_02025 [Rhodospirillales bacterium]|nr:hypothetical protein [Acetobacter sp.]
MGSAAQNPSGLGAEHAQTSRPRSKASTPDPRRSQGGQASGPSLFGLRIDSFTGSAPAPTATRPFAQATQVRPIVTSNSLSFGQRRARLRFLMHRPVPSTVSMAQAAATAHQRGEQDWRELADLVAAPEWDRTLPYGSVETACALND